MNRKTFAKGYEDNREFLVCFDGESDFGLIKHLYYEFPVPMPDPPSIIGNFVFSKIDFHSIHHYLKINNLIGDKFHDLLIDGERIFEDKRSDLIIPDFNIDTRQDRRISVEVTDRITMNPEIGIVGIIGVTLQDVPVEALEIHRPYTFYAKNLLFMAEHIEGSPSFGVF